MPTYQYRCSKCGHSFELRRSLFEKTPQKPACPTCGADDTERVYSVFGWGSSSSGCAPSAPGAPRRRFG
jgi:putative FmdB family regulatory protein